MINKDRLIRTFTELTAIDSLSLKERAMADILTLRLRELGLEVTEDDSKGSTGSNAGNLIARLTVPGKENEPYVLFSAHMDTVEPGIGKKAVIHEDGRITSDGSTVLGADDALGIAEILEAVQEVIEEGLPHHNTELLFTVAEELYTVGASAMDISKIKADRAYFLDRAGTVGSVTMTEPTLICFMINIEGKASHAGFAPEKGINSIVIASKAIASLNVGRINENTTLAIGMIDGGVAPNVVPASVKVSGEIRSQVHEEAHALLDKVKETFEAEADKVGGKVGFESTVHLTAYTVPDDSCALSKYEEVLSELGISCLKEKSFGGSDSNPFRRQGIDSLCIANAMWDIHSENEYTDTDSMASVTEIVKKLMIVRQKEE